LDGIHDVNSNEQLQVYATGAYVALGLTRSEKEKDFSIEIFSGEELLICYVITICALFELFPFRIY